MDARRGFAQNHLCSCGQPFLVCPFWLAVRARTALLDPAFPPANEMMQLEQCLDRYRFVPRMHLPRLRTATFDQKYHGLTSRLATWYSSIHQTAEGAIIIDSTKDPCYAHVLSTIPELNVGYVHLIRDSRGVAYSWTRPKPRPEITGWDATMDVWSAKRSAIEWDVKYVFSTLLGWVRRERVISIQYESLVRRPEQALRAIANLAAGLKMPPLGSRALDVASDRYHSVSGNPIRFDRPPPQFRLDDEWRTRMSPEDRLVVTALTAPFLLTRRGTRT